MRCRAAVRLDGEAARDALDFFRQYADRCHHGKEEDRLFPMMERHGFPADQGPVAVMRAEHEHGRALIRGMDAAIDGAADGDREQVEAWLSHATDYVALLREHIRKEDHCLFPMADQSLDEEAMRELADQFEVVESGELGRSLKRRYEAVADRLAARFGVTPSIEHEAHHG